MPTSKMQRDLNRLADTPFDLVVVGAGIYGALAAWEAARRGLTVALVDRGDFGGATSFNSLKTLHGGLRSLQSLNLPADAPVHPRAARDGADGAAPGRPAALLHPHLPAPDPQRRGAARGAGAHRRGRATTATTASWTRRCTCRADASSATPECLRLNPLIAYAGVTGGAVWYDYQMRQAERVTLSAVRSAADAGAVVANDVEAVGPDVVGRNESTDSTSATAAPAPPSMCVRAPC